MHSEFFFVYSLICLCYGKLIKLKLQICGTGNGLSNQHYTEIYTRNYTEHEHESLLLMLKGCTKTCFITFLLQRDNVRLLWCLFRKLYPKNSKCIVQLCPFIWHINQYVFLKDFFSRSALTFGANNKDKVKCLKKISWKLWTLNCWKKTYNILSSFGRRNICDVAMLCLQKWLKSAQPPADMQRGMVHCHFEWRLHTWLQSQANCHFFASALANSRKKSKASYIMCIFF